MNYYEDKNSSSVGFGYGPQADKKFEYTDLVEPVNSNWIYWERQFQRISTGKNGRFNLAGLFLSRFYALYRKAYGNYLKLFFIPMVMDFVSQFILIRAIDAGNVDAIWAGVWIMIIAAIWYLVGCFIQGATFNKQYYQRCIDNYRQGNVSGYGTNVFLPIIVFMVSLLIQVMIGNIDSVQLLYILLNS